MGEGRGSVMAVAALLGFLLLHSAAVDAAIYTVGGAGGWTFGVSGWPKGKRFRAGDILVFNYSPVAHNVIPVNKVRYNTCTTPRGAKIFKSGKDWIKLVKGQNFFICNFPGHCQSGLKMAVTAI